MNKFVFILSLCGKKLIHDVFKFVTTDENTEAWQGLKSIYPIVTSFMDDPKWKKKQYISFV